VGTRERLLDVAARHPDRLRIELNALATRVLFDADNRAVGVEYLKGDRLYRAHPGASDDPGERRAVHAGREVILAGGAFNTPQLLMLSGIGSRDGLGRHGVPVRLELPGVGRNLQDRYEIGVVNRMAKPWRVLDGADFTRDDPLFADWSRYRTGMYVSNGAALAVSLRSQSHLRVPDLFCMGLLAKFEGYFPGYSRVIAEHHDRLTWAILKAHTNNRAGKVTLRSADPRDTPLVNFRYFEEGSDTMGEDLKAVVTALRFVRRTTQEPRERGLIEREELPGESVQTDEQLADYVRDNAWGHHASCSCAIGPREASGVLDSRLRVHGVERLRVVDASVFPRIPGFFIVGAVYMVAEKAADMILEDA
jgi:choline dehydrogenase-like flavoprotein